MDPLQIAIEWAVTYIAHLFTWLVAHGTAAWSVIRTTAVEHGVLLSGIGFVIAGAVGLLVIRLVQTLAAIAVAIGLAMIGVGLWRMVV